MSEEQEFFDSGIDASNWWAVTDTPVRATERAAFLIDGRMTMLEMCVRFLSAKKYIHIAAWGLTPSLLMVRGKHHRAGPDGSLEQERLLLWLRNKGLSEQDMQFWQHADELSVANVLGYATSKGVDVRILLWDLYTLPFQIGAHQIREEFALSGVNCLPDDSCKGLMHQPLASLHQKAIVIDGRYAFVGGIDLMTRDDGEYDRWDTKGHLYFNLLRQNKNGQISHSWHDVHLLLEGVAALDVEHNFCQRWNELAERLQMPVEDLLEDPYPRAPLSDSNPDAIPVQITRTIPERVYLFTPPEGIATILETYRKAFARAKRNIYIENQYFWRRTFLGMENPLLGVPHADMEQLFATLVEALKRGVVVTFVVPDSPNVGREFTDDGLKFLWEISPQAVSSGALQVYTIGSSMQRGERVFYRPIYLHSKIAIVDDEWITIGSANLNNRGMRDDAEMNVALVHPPMAHGLRILLMAEHLGLSDEDTLFRIVEVMGRSHPTTELERLEGELGAQWDALQAQLGDPFAAMALFATQAKRNLEAIKASQPLEGHLLPYIRYDLAQEYQLRVHPVQGWLNQLAEEGPIIGDVTEWGA